MNKSRRSPNHSSAPREAKADDREAWRERCGDKDISKRSNPGAGNTPARRRPAANTIYISQDAAVIRTLLEALGYKVIVGGARE